MSRVLINPFTGYIYIHIIIYDMIFLNNTNFLLYYIMLNNIIVLNK